jgi:hypothetical protein
VEALLKSFPKARQLDIYLAGPESSIAPAREKLLAAGFPASKLTAMVV